MASSSARFAQISPEEFKDKNLCSKKTKNATTFSMNILVEFLKDRGYNEDVTTYSKVELSQALEDFYCNVRTKNGELYKKNSLLNIRQGISRFLKSNERTIDIINDSEFTKANSCFSSLLRKTWAEGKGSVDHHPAISIEDLQKLYNHELVFNMATPEGLLNKVMFEVILYFCRRGQENLHHLKVTDFAIEHVHGQQCVKKITTELSKNHQGTTNENEGTGALMFSTGTIRCPVISVEKYLSKRNKTSPRLFLHPKQSFTDEDEVWYRNEPIGVNAVKKFMKKLSKSAGLSREYTNHCIRSTTITLLNHCGFESRHIATISGHRNQASLSSYCYDTSDTQKKAMSDALSLCTGIQPKPTTKPTDACNGITATITSKEEVTNGTGVLVPIPSNALDIELNDEDLVHYATEMEISCTSTSCTSADVGQQNQPIFNFSGCTVTINNYMR